MRAGSTPNGMALAVEPVSPPHIERVTLCMGGPTPGLAIHAGDKEFSQQIRQTFRSDESNALEKLIHFKVELSKLDGEAFWSKLMIGMTEICLAQFSFVSKRVLFDDEKTAVEMPQLGEVGSCLMASALYYNNGKNAKGMHHDYKYHAWSCPCAHMKHDKVFLVSEGLSEFIGENPNELAFDCDAYLGVPLFADGKCFGHFGMMWTKEGVQEKAGLSWTFIEMFMHALEDLIISRLLMGETFAKAVAYEPLPTARVIPQDAILATQSLKVYARSLSHELRTPMQGVVGMLDLMYATVQEQIEGENSAAIRKIFRSLKENIEVVQDSSKRAIEAADNVVQAYDLNMQVPESPSDKLNTSKQNQVGANGSYFESKPNMIDGSTIVNPNKRKRSPGAKPDESCADCFPRSRRVRISPELQRNDSPRATPLRQIDDHFDLSPKMLSPRMQVVHAAPDSLAMPRPRAFSPFSIDTAASTPGLRQCNVREVLPQVINDSLRSGGRPDFAVGEPIPNGERIEVKTRSSNGYSSQKTVIWTVDADVPEHAAVDERDMTKLIGAVFLNAFKFTDEGEINVHARMSPSGQTLIITTTDTGSGIPEDFKPELFKAFSKEDVSLTRTKEGLGLGLLVAKGLARKVGGDLNLTRSFTEGPQRGSEFELRVPLVADGISSRSNTPFRPVREAETPRSAPTLQGLQQTTPHPRLLSPPAHLDSPTAPSSPSRIERPELVAEADASVTETKQIQTKPSMARRMSTKSTTKPDRQLAQKYPLTFLVAEDNKINRKLLVQMLNTLGYKDVHEAYDGKEAVRIVKSLVDERSARKRRGSNVRTQTPVDVILMDLWMPELDGYQATEQIFEMFRQNQKTGADVSAIGQDVPPTVLAVSADVTDDAIDKATATGMAGYMSKPFKVLDLQKLILEFCAPNHVHGQALPA